MKKRFATIFNDFEPVHLNKDVGMIPRLFSKKPDYNNSIIYFWDKTCSKSIIKNELVTIIPVKATSRILYYIKLVWSIKSSNVTVVNLYHNSMQTALLSVVFKFLGLNVYIKLDMNLNGLNLISTQYQSKSLLCKIKMFGLKKCDFLSVEDSFIFNSLISKKIFEKSKLHWVPNGILESPECNILVSRKRENKIIVVGRIGADEKSHEIILSSLEKGCLPENWSINFVGPIMDNFKEVVELFLDKNVKMKGRVKFLGNKNRSELFKLLSESKVFLMSSKYEGFSLAMVEAAYMGCYIVTTPVGGAIDITKSGKLGVIYDKSEIDKILLKIDSIKFDETYNQRIDYARTQFGLSNIIDNLIARTGL